MSYNIAVFGLYSSETHAADGVDQLRVAGFRNTDVSILYPENSGNKMDMGGVAFNLIEAVLVGSGVEVTRAFTRGLNHDE